MYLPNEVSATPQPIVSESAIDMLAQLFPHRKRSVLELVLRRCDLDLLRAIEQCGPTPSAFRPPISKVRYVLSTPGNLLFYPCITNRISRLPYTVRRISSRYKLNHISVQYSLIQSGYCQCQFQLQWVTYQTWHRGVHRKTVQCVSIQCRFNGTDILF